MLDFDATDMRRQPPVDTTWQQVLSPFLFPLISVAYLADGSFTRMNLHAKCRSITV